MLLLLGWLGILSPAQAQCPHPSITSQPKSLILLAGDTAVFSVGILDDKCALSYQWRRSGTPICPATCTNSTLRIYDVTSNAAGVYWVVVSNVSGSVTSSNAYLTVVSGPYPANQSVPEGADVTLTILVNGFRPAGNLNNQWQFNGEDLPGGTNFSLTLTNVQRSQAGAYSVKVSNPAGAVTTPGAIVRVLPPAPRLGCVSLDTNGLRFKVWGPPDATYVIQASEELAKWIDLSTNTVPASGNFDVIDPEAILFNGRYYRALQP